MGGEYIFQFQRSKQFRVDTTSLDCPTIIIITFKILYAYMSKERRLFSYRTLISNFESRMAYEYV